MFPLVVHQPASPSIWPAVQSLRRGLPTNPGATMWCVCGCSWRDDVCRVCECYRGGIVVMDGRLLHRRTALITATGCTLDKTQTYNICMTKHSHFPYTSTYSYTLHNIHYIPYTNTQHTLTVQGQKKLFSTITTTQQTFPHTPTHTVTTTDIKQKCAIYIHLLSLSI